MKHYRDRIGDIYMDVTDKATMMWIGVGLELFMVWQHGGRIHAIPIQSYEELTHAIDTERKVCIKIGTTDQLATLVNVNPENFERADKIIHDGYVYVRYNDLVDLH